MPRIARVVAVGYPHHVTQRRKYRQSIFSDDADRKKYVKFIDAEAKRYGLLILAYCLMTKHVHFIVLPEKEDSMAKVFKYAHMKYSQYYNKRMGECGHLFQGRFFSSVMDEMHTIACARYIERNAVRAKMVDSPELWEHSSAKGHCGMDNHDELGVNRLFDYIEYDQENWKEFINLPDSPQEVRKIREQTRKGRPLGNESFVEKLEEKVNMVLKPRPKGRPKRNPEK